MDLNPVDGYMVLSSTLCATAFSITLQHAVSWIQTIKTKLIYDYFEGNGNTAHAISRYVVIFFSPFTQYLLAQYCQMEDIVKEIE